MCSLSMVRSCKHSAILWQKASTVLYYRQKARQCYIIGRKLALCYIIGRKLDSAIL